MALYTSLSPDDIAAAVRPYGRAAPERAVPEPKGAINTSYHLWCGGERLFLRIAEGKTEADVAFEAEVLAYLRGARFPVPELLRADDGRPFVKLAGKLAMLFAYAAGEEIGRDGAAPERCRRIGEQIARLHELAAGFTAERANPYAPPRVRAWLEALRPDGGGDPEVAAALPLLEEELSFAERMPSSPRGLVHGDLFLDNVLWIGDRVACVLDWEMSCVDAFAYDLAVALNQWCYGDAYDPARARALVAGYRARRRAEPETLTALYGQARFAALRFSASRIHGARAAPGADRAPRKDWRRQRDRLVALREMGEDGFRALAGT